MLNFKLYYNLIFVFKYPKLLPFQDFLINEALPAATY